MIRTIQFRHERNLVSLISSAIVFLTTCFLASYSMAQVPAQSTRSMQVDDLFRYAKVSSPSLSPDGQWVAYHVTRVMDVNANKSQSNILIARVDGRSDARELTNSGKRDTNPKFSPDGKFILFESNRSGSSQLWTIPVDGGEARQLTDLATEVGNAIWSPDGSSVAFVSAVYPEYTTGSDQEIADANAKKLKEVAERPTKVRTFNQLFYRHWDSYVEGKRQHLFVLKVKLGQNGIQADGIPHDATPGNRDANPTSSTFSSGKDYCFSQDGSHLIFTATPTSKIERSIEAWSTNYDLCRVSINNTNVEWETLTPKNLAADSGPQVSFDGKTLAWRSQRKPGAEADRWLVSTQTISVDGRLSGSPVEHNLKDDVSVGEFTWADSRSLVFSAEWQGRHRIYELHLDGGPQSEVVLVDNTGGIGDLTPIASGELLFTKTTLQQPTEIFVLDKGRVQQDISRANTKLVAELRMGETRWTNDVALEDGRKMQMWIVLPPDFDPAKKYPTIYLVHGGPQGAWNDAWSFRWNPMLWAAQGYVVALPNPRGSTGFGQQFTDEISGDWGGKCYRDLMAGADYVAALPYVDRDRIAAAGASFGGYMMNWFAVNTNRFCTLVTHCSVFNFNSMWGSTDELWFDEHEHGGLPWEKPESYSKFSPQTYAANIAEYRTPMLVIHNDLDFRCPIGQGIELFTVLQRFSIPSRFVNFPDEGHWVLKPANSKVWHEEVFGWLDQYCKKKGR